jgi:hypothetical protein
MKTAGGCLGSSIDAAGKSAGATGRAVANLEREHEVIDQVGRSPWTAADALVGPPLQGLALL